jgi:RHS repeat-associated protein
MHIRSVGRFAVRCLSLVLLFAPLALSQTAPEVEKGIKLFGSYQGGGIDNVSLSNGGLVLQSPLLSYAQRGDLAYPVVLMYSSKSYALYQPPCLPPSKPSQCIHQFIFGEPPDGSPESAGNSVTLGFEGFPTVNLVDTGTGLSLNGNPQDINSNSALMPDGAQHQLVNTGSTLVAIDGSGWVGNNRGLTDSQGTINGALDRNGNQISATQDTLGRAFTAAPGPATPAGTPPASTATLGQCPALGYSNQPVTFAYSWSLPSTNGGSLALILCYASVYVRTNFFAGIDPTHYQEVNQSFTMLQSVVLPDNSRWAFQYDAADPNNTASFAYGELTQVAFPAGGSISYTYTGWGGCSSGFSRAVRTRTVNASSTDDVSRTWQYNLAGIGANHSLQNVVTAPDLNDTVHTFTGLGGICSLYETQVDYYQGSAASGTLLKTVKTDYQFTPNPYDSKAISTGRLDMAQSVTNVLPNRVTTILPNGLVSKVETDFDAALAYHGPLDGIQYNTQTCSLSGVDNTPICTYTAPTTMPVTNYTGSYGRPIARREFDWGQSTPGPLLRQTLTTYQWQVNSAYLSANLMNLPATVKVLDGSSNLCAETDYAYDEPGYLNTPSPAITTQHTSPPAGVRGNLTTVTHKLSNTPCSANAAWTNVSSHTAYFDTGEVKSSTDPLGHTTSHLYDLAYQGALSTQSCSPATAGGTVAHCVSGTYDFSTGLLTSLTNENATQQASGNTQGDPAHTSTFTYDSFLRLTQALAPTDPANGNLQASSTLIYPATAVFPETVTRKRSITSALSDSATSYFDGLGRAYQSDHVTPGGTAEVLTTYDAVGRVATVTNPYYVGSDHATDPTYGVTSNIYDALGRVITTVPQDGTATSNNVTTDYSNLPTITVTDQAGKQRRSRSDALGRLVEVDEPGSGANTAGTPASGAISVSGSLHSSTSSGTKATGWFSVNGSDQVTRSLVCSDVCTRKGPLVYDSGTLSVTVNGITVSVGYDQTTTAASLAAQLAAGFSGAGSPTAASYSGSGSTVNLTSNQAGPNYTMSWSSVTDDPADFNGGSFPITLSGSTLTGGVYPVTTFDSGTLTVTVNGFQASAAYNQNLNNTPAALATALAASLNSSSSPVTASASGTTITIIAKTVGTLGEFAVQGGTSTSFAASSTTLGSDTNPGGLFAPLVTYYSYDTLGNLLRVEQRGGTTDATQWRVRTFTYDSLSRLLTANNPESGTITYLYDADGELLQKTSPAPNQTGTATTTFTFCYDALHRMLAKGYVNSPNPPQQCTTTPPWLPNPTVVNTYDQAINAKGKLISMTDQAGTATYSYDILGRLTTETRTIAGVSKTTGYTYHLGGSVKTLTYPSGRVVTYTPDSAGRPLQAVDATGTNYVTAATYSPASSPTGLINGYSGSFAGITSSFQYNPRLQLCRITSFSSGSVPSSCIDAANHGNLMDRGYNYNLGAADNGNVTAITNYRDTTRSQAFTYDALNRLTSGWSSANTGVLSWGENYTIDAWSNLQIAPMPSKAHGGYFPNASDVTNRPLGLGYDAAGNLTNYTAPGQYVYDAENRLSSTAGTTYAYDGNGERVLKSNTSTGAAVKRYWSMGGNTLAEGDGSGNLTAEYIYFGGKRVARIDLPANSVHYYLSDHLNSTSIVVSAAGVPEEESDYSPFGTEVVVTSGPNKYKFTGKERDTETGLDLMGARYYGSALGRLVTPDPLMIQKQKLIDPQQWNMYQYARNNPQRFIDPTGMLLFVNGSGSDSYLRLLEEASGLTLRRDPKTGQVTIVKEPKKLSKIGSAIKGLIEDKRFSVKMTALQNKDAGRDLVLIGKFYGNGKHSIDMDDVRQVANAGGPPADATVVHETTEAAAGATGKNEGDAHQVGIYFENLRLVEEGQGQRQGETSIIRGNIVTLVVQYENHDVFVTFDRTKPGVIISVEVKGRESQE